MIVRLISPKAGTIELQLQAKYKNQKNAFTPREKRFKASSVETIIFHRSRYANFLALHLFGARILVPRKLKRSHR